MIRRAAPHGIAIPFADLLDARRLDVAHTGPQLITEFADFCSANLELMSAYAHASFGATTRQHQSNQG